MHSLTVIVYESSAPGKFLGQGLQWDVSVQADTRDEVKEAITTCVNAHVAACRQEGVCPHATTPPAPMRFWGMVNAAGVSQFEIPLPHPETI